MKRPTASDHRAAASTVEDGAVRADAVAEESARQDRRARPATTDAQPPLALLPHQVEAQTALLNQLASADRATALMACGTGKTLLGQRVSEALDARLTVVLLPSIALVAQTCAEWRRNALRPTTWLAACSDRTVGGLDDDICSAEVPVPVTTDAVVLQAAVASAPGAVVLFATYQSADVVAACELTWDLLLCDEAHRTTGAAGGVFGLALDDNRISARKRIFLTATARHYRGSAVASMDDEKLYGPVAHRIPFSAAIEAGLLCDYKIVVVGVAEREVRDRVTGAGDKAVRGRPLTLHETAAQAAVLRTMKRFELERVLTFHSRVKGAADFARTLPVAAAEMAGATVAVEHVSGKTPAAVRAEVLTRLAAGATQIVTNARCLTEGISIPNVDAVVFVDPRRSTVDVVQALGRAIRKAEGKTCGYVILPVFVGDGEEADRVARAGSFDAVWDVLRALRAHDDVLATQLDAARRAKGRGEPVRLPAKVVLDLPVDLPTDFYDAFTAQLVDDTTSAWEEMFARYEAAGSDTKDPTLRRWANNQRLRRRQGWMPREQIDRLSGLPGWQWSKALDATARQAAIVIIDQLRTTGMSWQAIADRLNSEQLPTATGGRWTASTVAAVRRDTPVRSRPDRWQAKYDRLIAWTKRNGPLRRRNDGLDADISNWISLQKQQYHRRSRSKLPADRAALLELVPGWNW